MESKFHFPKQKSLTSRSDSPKFARNLEVILNMRRPEIVKQIREAIRKVAPTATTILYGSEARGEARPDSDIDILVLLDGDKLTLKDIEAVEGTLCEIEWRTGVLISPLVVLKSNWENRPFVTPFYMNIIKDGIVL